MTARRVVILAAAAAVVVILAVIGTYPSVGPPGDSTTVTIVATAGSREVSMVVAPANFTVTQGQHVTIVFHNTDEQPHEFEIPVLGVGTGVVQGGQTVRVNFVPNEVGTFVALQPCSAGPAPLPPCGAVGYVTVLSP